MILFDILRQSREAVRLPLLIGAGSLGMMADASAQASDPATATDTIPVAELQDMIVRGSSLFNGGSCTFCHSTGGRRASLRGPNLSDPEWLHSDGRYEGIRNTIFWGVPRDRFKAVTRQFQMNPSGGMTLTGRERSDLAAYVWSLSRPEKSTFVREQARLLAMVWAGDVDGAIAAFNDYRTDNGGERLLPERGVNQLGYEVLQVQNEPARAIKVFTFNTELYPDSSNTWDSLAEAHMVNGDKELAIRFYEKSLDLNPDNQNAVQKLIELRGQPR